MRVNCLFYSTVYLLVWAHASNKCTTRARLKDYLAKINSVKSCEIEAHWIFFSAREQMKEKKQSARTIGNDMLILSLSLSLSRDSWLFFLFAVGDADAAVVVISCNSISIVCSLCCTICRLFSSRFYSIYRRRRTSQKCLLAILYLSNFFFIINDKWLYRFELKYQRKSSPLNDDRHAAYV